MKCLRAGLLLVLLAALALTSSSAALQKDKDKKGGEAFIDPVKAGPDFAIQGEYEGMQADGQRLGAQVVAEGDGKFTVVFLKGGLPGAGGDSKTRMKVPARSADGKTSFSGSGWNGLIANGKLTGENAEGAGFTLSRALRQSKTMGANPPAALVLFDGSNVNEWTNGKLTDDGLLNAGSTTRKTFTDFTLHVEFRLPFRPLARGQQRANSGVYLQGRYEIQILDSFGLEGKNNECGAIYTQVPPSVNMCFPPLSWQTYDIEFKAARFDASGKKTAAAIVTILHNGVKIHDKVAIKAPTGHGKPETATPGPINLQNHNNPVHFRNVWLTVPSGS